MENQDGKRFRVKNEMRGSNGVVLSFFFFGFEKGRKERTKEKRKRKGLGWGDFFQWKLNVIISCQYFGFSLA
jgi:hypothetical protein